MDDEYIDIELRPPPTVAERCVILAAIVRRLWIESSSASSRSEDWTAETFDLREWLRTEGLWNELTARESDILQRPVGDLTEDDIAGFACQAEGLATLGWALGLTNLVPFGDPGDITALVQAVPASWDSSAEWIRGARLIPEEDIARERDRAEMLAWRVGIEQPSRSATSSERLDYIAAIQEVTHEARDAGLLDRDDESEIFIGDRPLASLEDRDLERLGALAVERLRALNWLCGFGATWDDVPLDI